MRKNATLRELAHCNPEDGAGQINRKRSSSAFSYEDSAAKKPWISKCDDPKTLAQIDAVFVTVEKTGGATVEWQVASFCLSRS